MTQFSIQWIVSLNRLCQKWGQVQLTPEFLTETWKQMNRRGASGVDGETTEEFEQSLDPRVQELCKRLKQGAYRAPPVRRVEIPKWTCPLNPYPITECIS